MTNTLFLRLEGPLQSWGERARWSVRDTAPEPTKSGVIGLLGCALGLSEDAELRELSMRTQLAIRCDRPGVPLADYHTVTGGVMSAEGKIKINATTHEHETVVTWRHYLSDASFVAVVQSNDRPLIARLSAAVQSPHWPIYLGRKSCIPSRPIFEGTGDYPSLEAAVADWPCRQPLHTKADQVTLRAVIECLPTEGVRRRDEIDSRSRRTFLPRYTKDVTVTVKVQAEE